MPLENVPLKSTLCRQAELESDRLKRWAGRLQEPFFLQRKLWEWCYICEALDERGLLESGRRGLGFGVGREPLASLFAAMGSEVVATDLDFESAREIGWAGTSQHAESLEALNLRGLCDPATFRRLASFRVVDMNAIPDDLRGFDFSWSSCSLEHVGSIDLGLRFLERQLDCLRPGGVAVHTTEFNVCSDHETLSEGPTVLFRRRDIAKLQRRLRAGGHAIDLDLDPGDGLADGHIDAPPFTYNPHLKLRLAGHVTTSIGLIVEKSRRSETFRGRFLQYFRREPREAAA